MKIKMNQGWNRIEFESVDMDDALEIIELLASACKIETVFEITVAENLPELEEDVEEDDEE